MGSADKFVRFMVGTALLLNIIILEPGAVGTTVLLVLGVAMWATAWTGYCPAYKPLGICTCPASATCTCEAEAPAAKKEFKIVCNMSDTERFIRGLIGLAFFANIIALSPSLIGGIILFILGAAFLASAWKGYCPLYQYLGYDDCGDSCGKK